MATKPNTFKLEGDFVRVAGNRLIADEQTYDYGTAEADSLETLAERVREVVNLNGKGTITQFDTVTDPATRPNADFHVEDLRLPDGTPTFAFYYHVEYAGERYEFGRILAYPSNITLLTREEVIAGGAR